MVGFSQFKCLKYTKKVHYSGFKFCSDDKAAARINTCFLLIEYPLGSTWTPFQLLSPPSLLYGRGRLETKRCSPGFQDNPRVWCIRHSLYVSKSKAICDQQHSLPHL